MVTIGYKILFTINVLHDYYDDRRSKDTVVLPTNATLKILKNHQLLFKATDNGGLILARIIDGDGTLQVPITSSEKFKLSFYLKSSSPYFYNRTSLELDPSSVTNLIPNRQGFCFNNLNRNVLHKFQVPGFPKTGEEFDLKHLSKDTQTEVSTSDRLIYLPSVFRVKFNVPTNSFNINVKDVRGTEIVPTKAISSTENFTEFEIKSTKDLNLSEGLYNISINGNAAQRVYISDQLFHDKPFGLIEIFHPSDLGDFDFLKTVGVAPNEKIQVKGEADYFVWFKRRELKWRYIFNGTLPASVDAPTLPVSFASDVANKFFESDAVIEMKESYTTIKINNSKNIPNPDGRVLKAAFNGNLFSHYFAEVHL